MFEYLSFKSIKDKILSKINKFNYNKYDLLKDIALLIMIIDHIGMYLFSNVFILRVIGRMSMPIFIILHGYNYKLDIENKYKINYKILLFAIITSFIHFFCKNPNLPLNILYTIFFTDIFIKTAIKFYIDHKNTFLIFLLLFPLTFVIGIFLEYGLIVFFLMFLGFLLKQNNNVIHDRITIILLLLINIFYVSLELGFNLNYVLFYILFITFLLFYIKKNNLFDEVKIENIYLNRFLIFCSRFMLELYSLHILILSVIKCLL